MSARTSFAASVVAPETSTATRPVRSVVSLEICAPHRIRQSVPVVTVTLERARVRPGEIVVAQIRVTENGIPKIGTRVTLSVGVITIGSFATDGSGNARFGFAAPPNEGDAPVIVFAAGGSGSTTLTVAR